MSQAIHNISPLGGASFGVVITPAHPGQAVTDLDIDTLRSLTREHRLVALRGFADGKAAIDLAVYAEAWGQPMAWPFGTVLDVIPQSDAVDHIFASSHVPIHWDGMYREWVPEFQLFRCKVASVAGTGGRTIFVDTVALLRDLEPDTHRYWQSMAMTCRIDKLSHYGGAVRFDLVSRHPLTGDAILRYNAPADDGRAFCNRHAVTFHGIGKDEARQLISTLDSLLHDRRYCIAYAWADGDVVIADNFALLHGREGFEHGSHRHLQRVHVHATPPFENTGLLPSDNQD